MSAAVHMGAQINFGDLTPYLTYGWGHCSHKIVKKEAAYYYQYLCIYQESPVSDILTSTDYVLDIVFI